MDNKKLVLTVIAIVVLAGGVAFLLLSQTETLEPPIESVELMDPNRGAVETAKDISKSVPEIQTNVGEEIPEINPIDRANPFKYENPLR